MSSNTIHPTPLNLLTMAKERKDSSCRWTKPFYRGCDSGGQIPCVCFPRRVPGLESKDCQEPQSYRRQGGCRSQYIWCIHGIRWERRHAHRPTHSSRQRSPPASAKRRASLFHQASRCPPPPGSPQLDKHARSLGSRSYPYSHELPNSWSFGCPVGTHRKDERTPSRQRHPPCPSTWNHICFWR